MSSEERRGQIAFGGSERDCLSFAQRYFSGK